MKKTITINLANRVFQIEEDAYMMLEQYLNGLRAYFKRTDPDGEITDDIENRISELFAEKKRLGHEVITVDITSEVIHRMGDMSDFIDTDEETSSTAGTTYTETTSEPEREKVQRKFYRDISNKWVAGVLSGLAAYVNIDVWVLRLVFIFLLFTPITLFLIVFYIACAIFIDPAITVNQRLEMKGEAVSPDAIWKKISEESKDFGDKISDGFSKVRTKYNLGYEKNETTAEKKPKRSWTSWLWGILGIIIALALCFGFLYLISPDLVEGFRAGYYSIDDPEHILESIAYMFAGGLGLLSIVIIPLMILCGILFFLLGLAILIVPIGVILKTPFHIIIKILLIIGWFMLFFYVLS
ncbi:DNA-binding transcriptional activator PspC [Porphyromonas cangingivalis]|uniref:PspC domain-containing protein n=1 Tax=Porphyromonas cangingivalis TaxID=36874 RepID=UPI000D9C8814|nr:PspC domain-containing protein [Porphyromonas cangingivalis]SPY35423.1 DNA-binding transcriptional activator PspC [Porphyromonas cangingivalis]